MGAGALLDIVSVLPGKKDENLLVGFDSADDAAVYKLSDDLAMIQTLDFFPPMVNDPYLFGKIAAANSLSDVYAMGGEVLTAMNILAVPERMPMEQVGEILRGGAEKVLESGGVLVGGHSIHDATPKYGLSVAGRVHPDKIWKNNSVKDGDVLILTKPLGIGLVTMAYSVGETSEENFVNTTEVMMTLNKYAAEVMMKYNVSAATDITGFGFLGHLSEMLGGNYSADIYTGNIPVLPGALESASEFIVSAGGQKNRNHLHERMKFIEKYPAMEEVLYDPQTSGGLLFSLSEEEALKALPELKKVNPSISIVGRIKKKEDHEITVYPDRMYPKE